MHFQPALSGDRVVGRLQLQMRSQCRHTHAEPASLPMSVLQSMHRAPMSSDCCCTVFRNPSGADISYMEQLLAEIEKAGAHRHAV